MSNNSGIYKITLIEDNRCYIGSAVNIEDRWYNHKKAVSSCKKGQVITRALRKYGIDSFKWEILEYCNIDNLISREQFYLDKIRPFADEGRGFNVRKIADSNLGVKFSDETKKLQSDQRRGKLKSKETKRKMSEVWHNSRDEKYYKLLSERMSGDKNPSKRKDVREKISRSNKGKKWKDSPIRKENHIKLHSYLKKEQWKDSEYRDKMLKTHIGSKRSEEQKANMREWQQRTYILIDIDDNRKVIKTYELKCFCKENNLIYNNLLMTLKTNKFYKKKWKLEIIDK